MIEDILNDFAHVLAKENKAVFYTRSLLSLNLKCVNLKRKVHLQNVFLVKFPRFRRIWLFCSSSPIWWFTFAGVFNWTAIDNLIISRGTGNSIRLQAGKCVSCPARCRVISAFTPFLSLTINPEMEARLPFPPHSTLLHHYWTILCILWWK